MGSLVRQTVMDMCDRHTAARKESKQVYRTIVTDCLKQVTRKDQGGRQNMVYRVPFVVYGNPNYDMRVASLYIIRELSRHGFVVLPFVNNFLYVDWSVLMNHHDQQRLNGASSKARLPLLPPPPAKHVRFATN
eukprot:6510401-Pyramimonas_sp.AAC.1